MANRSLIPPPLLVHRWILDDPRVESPETVAARLRGALRFLPPHRLIAAANCGMKYLPRDVALGKLQALVAGARLVRAALEGMSMGRMPTNADGT